MTQAALDHFLAEHTDFQSNPSPFLKQQRQSGIDELGRIGFPTTRHEAWKYTDVKQLLKRNFVRPETEISPSETDLLEQLRFPELDCLEIVFINGRYSESLSSHSTDILAGSITALSTASPEQLKFAEKHISQYAKQDKHGFAALNTAFVNDGALISIADNVELNKPIHLIFVSGKQNHSFISHPRNLIFLGTNAKATVIESYAGSAGAEYCTNTLTEIVTSTGSRLEHYKLQDESQSAFHIGYTHAHLGKDSHVHSHSVSLGGALVRNDIDAVLAAPGSHMGLNGLYMASAEQHVDNHTRVDHQSPHTTSDETYRGVLDGKARAVFNGKVVVHKDAQKTDAQQSNSNLLMSDDAEIDTKPELEIYADDVKCSHGATVGQLDENMLFYLRSRAISEDTARSLLTFAFVDEVIKRIELEPIRLRLEKNVVGLLPDASLIREFVQ